jgi:hypothetical protein
LRSQASILNSCAISVAHALQHEHGSGGIDHRAGAAGILSGEFCRRRFAQVVSQPDRAVGLVGNAQPFLRDGIDRLVAVLVDRMTARDERVDVEVIDLEPLQLFDQRLANRALQLEAAEIILNG